RIVADRASASRVGGCRRDSVVDGVSADARRRAGVLRHGRHAGGGGGDPGAGRTPALDAGACGGRPRARAPGAHTPRPDPAIAPVPSAPANGTGSRRVASIVGSAECICEADPRFGGGMTRNNAHDVNSLIRGASPLGLPYTRPRSPLRRLAPVAWLARNARSR